MLVTIIYTYFESDISKQNLEFFLQHGIINDPKYKYILIINGDTCSIDLSSFNQINIIKRKNIGYDFGGWSHGLKILDYPNKMNVDDRIILMNSTICGPYCSSNQNWINEFINLVDETTKLGGISINCHIWDGYVLPHVQSMLLVTDKIGLKIGTDKNIFNGEECLVKAEFIFNKEIGFSSWIIHYGFNINCILPLYRNKEYRHGSDRITNSFNSLFGDPFHPHHYFNRTINPYEAIFIKTNRDIIYDYTNYYEIYIDIFQAVYRSKYKKNIVTSQLPKIISIGHILNIEPNKLFGDVHPDESKYLIITDKYGKTHKFEEYAGYFVTYKKMI
jgi:hypothetical protein